MALPSAHETRFDHVDHHEPEPTIGAGIVALLSRLIGPDEH